MSLITTDDLIVVRHTLLAGGPLFCRKEEQTIGTWMGQTRFERDIDRGCKPRVKERSLEQDIIGAWAEVAVASTLGLCPKLEFDKYLAYDLHLAGGEEFGVSYDPHGWCILDEGRSKADQARGNAPAFYIIVTGPPPHFTFAGWATYADVLAAPLANHFSNGPCYLLKTLRTRLEILTLPKGSGYREG